MLVEQYQGPLTFLLSFTAMPTELTSRPVTLTVRTMPFYPNLGLSLGDQVRLSGAPGRSDGVLQLPLEPLPRLHAGRLGRSEGERGIRLNGAVSVDDLRHIVPGY